MEKDTNAAIKVFSMIKQSPLAQRRLSPKKDLSISFTHGLSRVSKTSAEMENRLNGFHRVSAFRGTCLKPGVN